MIEANSLTLPLFFLPSFLFLSFINSFLKNFSNNLFIARSIQWESDALVMLSTSPSCIFLGRPSNTQTKSYSHLIKCLFNESMYKNLQIWELNYTWNRMTGYSVFNIDAQHSYDLFPLPLRSLFLAPILSCETTLLLAQAKINGQILLLSGQWKKFQVLKKKKNLETKHQNQVFSPRAVSSFVLISVCHFWCFNERCQ